MSLPLMWSEFYRIEIPHSSWDDMGWWRMAPWEPRVSYFHALRRYWQLNTWTYLVAADVNDLIPSVNWKLRVYHPVYLCFPSCSNFHLYLANRVV